MKAQVKKIATRGTVACALASAMAFAAPTLAFAAEKETAGISAILPAMDEFIPMLVAFLILLAILAKFGWPMFNGILEKRETTIREALEKSEQARIEAERVLAEYQDKLIEAVRKRLRSSPRPSSRLRRNALPPLPRPRRKPRRSSPSLARRCRPRRTPPSPSFRHPSLTSHVLP